MIFSPVQAAHGGKPTLHQQQQRAGLWVRSVTANPVIQDPGISVAQGAGPTRGKSPVTVLQDVDRSCSNPLTTPGTWFAFDFNQSSCLEVTCRATGAGLAENLTSQSITCQVLPRGHWDVVAEYTEPCSNKKTEGHPAQLSDSLVKQQPFPLHDLDPASLRMMDENISMAGKHLDLGMLGFFTLQTVLGRRFKDPQTRRQGDLGLLRGVVMDTDSFQLYSTVGISLMDFLVPPLQPRSAKDAVMATGCHPPTEVTEIRGASGGMLQAHQELHIPGQEEAKNGVMRCVKLRGGGCSECSFIPAPPSAISPLCEPGDSGVLCPPPSLFAGVTKPLAS
ncbi:hypothetical protein DV515_00007355 [Chloebia gouldiae]|uniref:Uncharacterized protein n=1 Tax=Chloebia gouldiae TaxID=44316 RepID=A0A3L8SIN9_CHLGU|nr:hypothetical protein DV515_00007355 [Chloebia gouldiae]